MPGTRNAGRYFDDPTCLDAKADILGPTVGQQGGGGVQDHGDSLDLHYV
jgi:hypothetical protein